MKYKTAEPLFRSSLLAGAEGKTKASERAVSVSALRLQGTDGFDRNSMAKRILRKMRLIQTTMMALQSAIFWALPLSAGCAAHQTKNGSSGASERWYKG